MSLNWAMGLQYAVGGALMPFLTLLLRDRGLGMAEVSVVLFAGASVMLVSPFLWGMLADRFVPLDRLFVAMNLAAAGALFFLLPQRSFGGLLVAFVLFYACYQPAPMLVNALALRHLPDPHRQFGPVRVWGSVGWLVPSLPVFVWLALGRSQNFEFVLPLTMGVAVAMAGVALKLPHTPPGAGRRVTSAGAAPGYVQGMRRLLRNPSFLVVLGSYFLVSASFAIQAFYAPMRLADLGMGRAWIGLVQTIGIVVEVVLFLWRAPVVNRLGYTGSILLGCLTLAIRQFLFVGVDNFWVLALSYGLVGATVVLYHIGISLLVEAIAGPEVKSTAQTLLVLCSSGLGPMFANAMVGWLAPGAHPDLHRLFLFAGVLPLLALALIFSRGSRLLPAARTEAGRRPPGPETPDETAAWES